MVSKFENYEEYRNISLNAQELMLQLRRDIEKIDIGSCTEWEHGYRKGLIAAAKIVQEMSIEAKGE